MVPRAKEGSGLAELLLAVRKGGHSEAAWVVHGMRLQTVGIAVAAVAVAAGHFVSNRANVSESESLQDGHSNAIVEMRKAPRFSPPGRGARCAPQHERSSRDHHRM